MNPTDLIHSLLRHRLSWQFIVAFALNICEVLWGEGIYIIMKHIYLNDYVEFDSKISYIMFLHYYLLACIISTVRTLALK